MHDTPPVPNQFVLRSEKVPLRSQSIIWPLQSESNLLNRLFVYILYIKSVLIIKRLRNIFFYWLHSGFTQVPNQLVIIFACFLASAQTQRK